MQLTKEKSEEQAAIISMIAIYVNTLDVDYLTAFASEVIEQASRQHAMSVLSSSRSVIEKSDLLMAQGLAVRALVDYILALKEVDRCKKNLVKMEDTAAQIEKLFM